jgi:hypothetical protein
MGGTSFLAEARGCGGELQEPDIWAQILVPTRGHVLRRRGLDRVFEGPIIGSCSTVIDIRPAETKENEENEAPQDPWTHFCIVRRDLPRGTQAAQLIHAAGHSSPGMNLPAGTYAIALSCKDEFELQTLSERLMAAEIPHHRICEPDEPYNGELMALGLPPAYKSTYRRFVSNLPLIK